MARYTNHVSLTFKALLSIAATLSLLACSNDARGAVDEAENQSSIIAGRAARDRAVVALHLGEGLCTGTLIAPRLVLTARHCVSLTTEIVRCPSRATQLRGERDPTTIGVSLGNDADAPIRAYGRTFVVPTGTGLCERDIALMTLDRAIDDVTPATIATQPPEVGDVLRFVGYGRTADDGDYGKKRARTVTLEGMSASELMVGEVVCSGDSGGPAFDAHKRVVGVVSRGGPGCEGATLNIATRVDVWRPLIDQAIALSVNEPTAVRARSLDGG